MADRAQGFWSYVREDDTGEGGRIRDLAERVKAAYALLTGGVELELFLDLASLEWGDDWELKIEQALQSTTFFIPIVTPRYVKSRACRDELLAFSGHAASLGLEALLLPIYWVEVPELEAPDTDRDEVAGRLSRHEREDWRERRLLDVDGQEYRQAVHRLAARLVAIGRSTESAAPPNGKSGDAEEHTPDAPEDDEEDDSEPPTQIETLVRLEELMPELADTLSAIGEELTRLGALTEQATTEMHESDASGAGFKGRLLVANRLAERLAEPAERVDLLATTYAASLVEMDPGVLLMLRMASEVPPEEQAEAEGLYDGIRTMVSASRQAATMMEELGGILDENANLSRELRKPLKKIRGALRDILDGQAIIEGWEKRVEELGSSEPPPSAHAT